MPDSHHDPVAATARLELDASTRVGVSAVIVSYFTGPVLDECLAHALAADDVIEVIVVDNGNPAEVSAALAARAAVDSRLRLFAGQGNVGFAAGCNIGAAAARGRHLLFVNPDLTLEPNAAARMAAAAEGYAKAGGCGPCIVGGRLMDPVTGREQRGSRRDRLTLWNAVTGFTGLSALERLHPAFRSPHRERDPLPPAAVPMPVVSGALMLVPAADFARLGGFDERYFLHVEDIDICRRAVLDGGEVLFEPNARGFHEGSTSRTSWLAVERHKADGLALYFKTSARNGVERALAQALAAVFRALLYARGFVLRLRMPR